MLQSNISLLLKTPVNHNFFDSSKLRDEDSFFADFKSKAQQHELYIRERKEFYKLHPAWSLFYAREKFAEKFLETLLKDLDQFQERFYVSSDEMFAKRFTEEYFYYREIIGEELILRVVQRIKR